MAHTSSSLQALYTVFIAPILRANIPTRVLLLHTVPPSRHSRTFTSSSSTRHASPLTDPAAASSGSGRRRQKWDEEITARLIHLVDPITGKLSEPRKRVDVLRALDRRTQRLVQVSADDEPGNRGGQHHQQQHVTAPVVCKIVDKRVQYQQERERKRQKKQEQAGTGSGKTIELNWAIDPNDLGHRLERLAEFLGDGRRVEVVLAAKKKGRKATMGECEALVKRVMETMERVKGAKELKPLEGQLGGFATWVLQGKVAGS